MKEVRIGGLGEGFFVIKLRPMIASYSSEAAIAIRNVLSARALKMVARVALAPVPVVVLDQMVSARLVNVEAGS
jgi:hypothetical protein